MQTINEKDAAPVIEKPIYFTEDDDILFAAPPRIAAIGVIRQRGKAEMVADACMNGGRDGVVMLPAFNTVYVTGDELDVLGVALDAIRSGALKIMTQMTPEQLEACDEERIGEEHSCQPFLF